MVIKLIWLKTVRDIKIEYISFPPMDSFSYGIFRFLSICGNPEQKYTADSQPTKYMSSTHCSDLGLSFAELVIYSQSPGHSSLKDPRFRWNNFPLCVTHPLSSFIQITNREFSGWLTAVVHIRNTVIKFAAHMSSGWIDIFVVWEFH